MYDISKLPKPISLAYKKFEPNENLNKSPVIIQHGLFNSKSFWFQTAQKIVDSSKRTVWCIDSRNHGDTIHTENGMDFITLVSDAINFCNEMGIEKAIFIGHSLGGITFARVATLFPNLVEELILIDIHPFNERNPEEVRHIIESFALSLKNLVENLKKEGLVNLNEGRKRLLDEMKPLIQDEIDRIKLSEELISKDGHLEWKFNLHDLSKLFNNMKYIKDLKPNYNGQCLEIYGSKSNCFIKDDVESVLQIIPNTRFVEIADGTHWNLQSVHFDQFIKEILNFIDT